MKSTFLYEIKKVCRQRSVIILIVLMCVLNIAAPFFFSPVEEKSESYGEEYYKRIDDIIYDAKTNYRYIEDKNSSIALYQLGVIDHYSELLDNDVSGDVRGYDILLSSPIPYVSALVITLFISFTSSNTEVSSNLIVQTFREKLRRIATEKMLLTVLIAFAVNLTAILSAVVGVGFGVGYVGGGESVASLQKYMYCPYDITVLEAVILRVLVSYLVSFTMSLFVHLITFAVRKFVMTAVGMVLVVSIDMLLTSVSTDFLDLFYNFNIISALTDSFLLRYSGVKVGIFLSRVQFEVFVLLLLSALLIAAFVCVVGAYRSMRTVKNKKKTKAARVNSVRRGLWKYEIKKLYSVRTLLIVLVMIVLECAILFSKTEMPYRAYDIAYKNYVTMMSEMSFEEQVAFLMETQEQAFADKNAGDRALELSKAGEIEYDEYIALVEKAGAAELIISVFEKIDEQLFSIAALRSEGIDATLVYATGWDILYTRGPDYILIITLLLLLAPYAAEELDSNYQSILNGSFYGLDRARTAFKLRKLTVMMISAVILIALFMGAELLLLNLRIGLPSWDKYAVGAGIMPADISLYLWQMIVFRFVWSVLGAVVLILSLELLTRMKLKSIPTILIMFVYSAILAVICWLTGVYTSADLTSYYSYGVFDSSILNISLQSAAAIVVITAAIAVTVVKKTQTNVNT